MIRTFLKEYQIMYICTDRKEDDMWVDHESDGQLQ